MKTRAVALYILIVVFFSCKDKTAVNLSEKQPEPLFSEIAPSHSGITFRNEIPESSRMNSMVYEYFYNGGGVAVGDVNNDGLPDIYFTSNLKENKLYINKGDFTFEDRTDRSGTQGSFGWTTGVTMVDINADGWLDIYVCKSGKGKAENRQNELFINNKNGTFTERAAQYGLNFSGYSTQAAFFDYDRDGDLDMYLLNHNVNPILTNNPERFKEKTDPRIGDHLFRNDSGKFIDVSKKAGIIQNVMGFGLGISIGDLNNDGWPDIYVANDYIEHDYLYFNNGNGTFTESLKIATGHTSNFSMGTDIADFNNDGLLDIISLDMVAEDNYGIKTSMSGMNPQAFNHAVNHGFHYQYMFNALQCNITGRHFSDIAQLAGVSNTDWSWAPLFADFDNDGFKDLFITNGLKRDFRNNDFRKYKIQRITEARNNNESINKIVEELVEKTPRRKALNYLFKNQGDLRFTNSTEAWGITEATYSNGAAYADLDNDGDLDIVVNNVDQEATVLKNNAVNNYIQLQFKGNKKNPRGIGCRAEVITKNGTQIFENYPTRGYQSSVPSIVHGGVGALEKIKKITVRWPDGNIQYLHEVRVNQRIEVNYDNALADRSFVKKTEKPLFRDITEETGITHRHFENDYDDYGLESLLPHKMSEFGPALAVTDVNGDGLEDFYVGGAKGYAAALYVQQPDGAFSRLNEHLWESDKKYEDVAAIFFDADNDNDPDLYVVSGGNEWKANSAFYQDRLYINRKGKFTRKDEKLPEITSSGGCVKPFDYDHDGDLDLFVGTRLLPQKYPFPGRSYLLENHQGFFKDVTQDIIPELKNIGLVTDAVWSDYDQDGQTDLIIAGEWMEITFFNRNGREFQKKSVLPNTAGWWNTIEKADLDEDGDMDYVLGNLGLNYKYKASTEEPFEVFANDFDDNGTNDIVLGYYNNAQLFPLRGRECSSNQMPFIKEKFPTYNAFGSAKLVEVYGKEKLLGALHLKAGMFASVILENRGDGTFDIHKLPVEAQLSSVNAIVLDDFDGDGLKDIALAGNLYQSEIETPRNDAGYGLLLKNNGSFRFQAVPAIKSGLFIKGDVKNLCPIKIRNTKSILAGRNNEELIIFSTGSDH